MRARDLLSRVAIVLWIDRDGVMHRNRWRLQGPDRDMSRERLDRRESNKLERRRRVGVFGT
jgi:hypothetical protein